MASFGFNLILVISAVLIFFTTTGYSLKCYDCASPVGGICGNFTSFNKTNVDKRNCTEKDQVCGIDIEKGTVTGQIPKITRSCVPVDYCKTRNVTTDGGITDCQLCKTNLCNSSYHMLPPFGIITFLVLCFSCLYFDMHI